MRLNGRVSRLEARWTAAAPEDYCLSVALRVVLWGLQADVVDMPS